MNDDFEQNLSAEPGETTITALGIDQNIEAMLCYMLSWVTGILFLFIEKKNLFVRFHALQSLITFLALWAISLIGTNIPFIGIIFKLALYPLQIVLWIFMMYQAFQNKVYKLPFSGDIAYAQVYGQKTSTTSKESCDE